MKTNSARVVSLFALLLAGCASQPVVTTDQAKDIDLNQFRSFAVVARDAGGAAGNLKLGPSHLAAIRSSVEAGMVGKGYEPVASGEAQLLLNVHHATETKFASGSFGYSTQRWETTTVHHPSLVGRAMGQRSTVRTHHYGAAFRDDLHQYEENLWILDLVDARTKELVWRGWARETAPLDRLSTEEVAKIMGHLVAKVPARSPR